MKIHGMCLIKNESDIIKQTLNAALSWCDYIYVFDNGSTDGTWEKVLQLAELHEQIIPYNQDDKPYSRDLVGEIFNHYRSNSNEGDWWCRLDADEFYIDNPRIFLAKIPAKFGMVYKASFEYYFTDKDLERYNQDPSLYSDSVPIEEKCRYYINNWSEPRFIRYQNDLEWAIGDGGWPSQAWNFPVYPVRIWLKHYQYRSPHQIQKRIDIRRQAILNKAGFLHEAQADWEKLVQNQSNMEFDFHKLDLENIPKNWQERVVTVDGLNYDTGDRKLVIREDLMPELPVESKRNGDLFGNMKNRVLSYLK